MELVRIDDAGRVAEFSATDSALAGLRERFKGAIFPVDTPAGMRDAKAARAELRGLRTDLERKRKELKAPLLEAGRIVDAEAKRITGELSAMEDPIDAQIGAEEARKEAERAERERIERERVAGILQKVAVLKSYRTHEAFAGASASIADTLKMLEQSPPTAEDFSEFIAEAKAAHAQAIEHLQAAFAEAVAAETEAAERRASQEAEAARIAAERAELDRQRAEHEAAVAAERERMAAEQSALDEERERIARDKRERQEAAERAEAQRRAEEQRAQAAREAEERRQREAAEAQARAEADARAKLEQEQAIERATLDEAIGEVLAWAEREGVDHEMPFRKLAAALRREVEA